MSQKTNSRKKISLPAFPGKETSLAKPCNYCGQEILTGKRDSNRDVVFREFWKIRLEEWETGVIAEEGEMKAKESLNSAALT